MCVLLVYFIELTIGVTAVKLNLLYFYGDLNSDACGYCVNEKDFHCWNSTLHLDKW